MANPVVTEGYFYLDANRELVGLLSPAQLKEKVVAGQLTLDSWVWRITRRGKDEFISRVKVAVVTEAAD